MKTIPAPIPVENPVQLLDNATVAWNEAENLSDEIRRLERRRLALTEAAIKGWAMAEVDRPQRFSATLVSPTGTITFPEQTLGLATFLQTVRNNHPHATNVVITIAL